MKRSEMYAWLTGVPLPGVSLSRAFCEAVLEKFEAAGVAWDPEESLPERLYICESGGHMVVVADRGPGIVEPWIFILPEPETDLPGTLDFRKRMAAEAVRRWSAWKELRELVDNTPDDLPMDRVRDFKACLLAILDGREQP